MAPPLQEYDSDFESYTCELEKAWRASVPKYTDEELFKIFPEAKDILLVKLKEYGDECHGLEQGITTKIAHIRYNTTDSRLEYEGFWKAFWRGLVKYTDVKRLVQVEKHMARLKRQMCIAHGDPSAQLSIRKESQRHYTPEQVQTACAVPLETLYDGQLRKSGKRLVGLCPFHNEKTPSFYVFTENNRCWCFGCQQGGDVIDYLRLTQNLTFKESIKYLLDL